MLYIKDFEINFVLSIADKIAFFPLSFLSLNSINHICFKASFAVILSFGNLANNFFNKSLPLFNPLLNSFHFIKKNFTQ